MGAKAPEGFCSTIDEVMDNMDSWVQRLTAPLHPAQAVKRAGRYYWEFGHGALVEAGEVT